MRAHLGAALEAGQATGWSEAPGTPDEIIGEDLVLWHSAEIARGIRMPIQIYPIFDVALRAALGESVDAHLRRISELWAGFSAVAAGNPNAWIRERRSAEEIRTPGPENRPVSFPYPMLMNSNSRVDMGAALVLTHEERARELGVPREKWVYPHAATDAHDHLTSRSATSCSARPRSGSRAAARSSSRESSRRISPIAISTAASRARCRSPRASSGSSRIRRSP